jgi:hypothetical protein
LRILSDSTNLILGLCRALQRERNDAQKRLDDLETKLRKNFGDMAVEALLESDDFDDLYFYEQEEEIEEILDGDLKDVETPMFSDKKLNVLEGSAAA